MPATPGQARDQMSLAFKTAVGNSAYSTMPILWDDVDSQPPTTDPSVPWARFLIKHTRGRQASLTGALRTQRWIRGGLIIVQLFSPGGDGQRVQDDLLTIILGAYEGKTTTGGLLFRNARINEIGQSGPWHQTNVVIEFEYDEIK